MSRPRPTREGVGAYVRSHELKPETVPALIKLVDGAAAQVAAIWQLSRVPTDAVDNVRNDMYLPPRRSA